MRENFKNETLNAGDSGKKFFYIFIIILTISINLLSIIAGKYIGINLGVTGLLILWLFVMAITYSLKFALWIILHRKFQLSFIYPFLSLNYFLSLFLGKILFQELITPRKIAGSAIIVVGVFIISMSGKKLEGVWDMLYFYIFLAVVVQFLVALAQVILKIGARQLDFKNPIIHNFKNKYLIISICLFVLVPVLSIISMRVVDFSDFYSFTALSYFFIMLFSWKVLREDMDKIRIIGNILVIVGVVIFNL
jgi:drug/metabolite transporter (DMT)-like permease